MSTQDKNYLSQIYERKIESLKFWIIIQKFIIDHSRGARRLLNLKNKVCECILNINIF